MSDANSNDPPFRLIDFIPAKEVDDVQVGERVEVDHPEIKAVIFVTVVEDPQDDWADIFVDLKDGSRYSFTAYTPSQIVSEMENAGLLGHNDSDQLIVREMTVPCIVDAVQKMLEMGCIDRMGILQVRSPELRTVEWQRGGASDAGTEIIAELTNGRRYRFTAYSVASIVEDLRRADRLSFVRDGLLVVKEVSVECIQTALKEIVEWDSADHNGVPLDAR